jgi:hypothetical protein
MTINISFGGAQISRPGAYSVVDTSGMTPVTVGALKTLAVVGEIPASSTLPTTKVSFFNDPKEAATAIGEGELLEVMRVMWGHGADLIGVAPVQKAAAQPTDAEWQAAIDLMQPEFIAGIVPVTTTAAVLTKIDAHVTLMSSVKNRRSRRAFYGHATGLTLDAVKVLATFASERAVLATPCPMIPDATGVLVAKPSYYMAAAVAGLWAGLPSQEPVTYKNVKFTALETTYMGADIEELLAAHILPIEVVQNVGFRIVQGITTDATEDLTKNELSVSTLKDDMSSNLVTYFENKYIGKAGVAGIEVTIYNDLVSQIEAFLKAGWISGYVADSLKVTKNGTAFFLEWEGKPTLPINNFLITSHFTL